MGRYISRERVSPSVPSRRLFFSVGSLGGFRCCLSSGDNTLRVPCGSSGKSVHHQTQGRSIGGSVNDHLQATEVPRCASEKGGGALLQKGLAVARHRNVQDRQEGWPGRMREPLGDRTNPWPWKRWSISSSFSLSLSLDPLWSHVWWWSRLRMASGKRFTSEIEGFREEGVCAMALLCLPRSSLPP